MSGDWVGLAEALASASWKLLKRIVLWVVIIAAVIYSAYRLRNVITTLFIAAIIGYVLDWPVDGLCKRKGFVKFHQGLNDAMGRMMATLRRKPHQDARIHKHTLRTYATLYVFILTALVVWQGTKLVVSPFVAEFKSATSEGKWDQKQEELRKSLKRYDSSAPDWAKSDKIAEQVKKLDIAKALQNVAGEVGLKVLESLKNVVEVVVLPVLAFYFLIDGRKIKHEFVALLPRKWTSGFVRMVNEFNLIMHSFVVGQFILCSLAGVVVGLGLAALHVQYPFLLGLLAGITRAIPIIGPIIGGIPIIALTFADQGMGTALGVLGFFTFLHFAESKAIMPLLIGERMELHPVVIILVLIVGGEVGGVLLGGSIGSLLGMFFAAPIAAIFRVIIRRYWLHLPAHPRKTQHHTTRG